MTREEAIELLCAYGVPQDEKRFQEALDMAIEALSVYTYTEQSDLISRADAIDALYRSSVYSWSVEQDQSAHTWALNIIAELPSADRPSVDWVYK